MTDRFWSWLAWRLPRRLVYWAYIRLATYGTDQPPWSHMNPGEQLVSQPMDRWTGNPPMEQEPQTIEEQQREALIWMSGASDFAPSGKAREGFEKMVLPLLSQTDRETA